MAEQKGGYIEFRPGEDWWPEDRMTEALRKAPRPKMVVQDDAYYRAILDRVMPEKKKAGR